MILKYAKILNFDSIIMNGWIEIANELFGKQGCIGIADSRISPFLEREAIKNFGSLIGAMRTIEGCLPEEKRTEFVDRCYKDTEVVYGLKDVCDSLGNTQCAI